MAHQNLGRCTYALLRRAATGGSLPGCLGWLDGRRAAAIQSVLGGSGILHALDAAACHAWGARGFHTSPGMSMWLKFTFKLGV